MLKNNQEETRKDKYYLLLHGYFIWLRSNANPNNSEYVRDTANLLHNIPDMLMYCEGLKGLNEWRKNQLKRFEEKHEKLPFSPFD